MVNANTFHSLRKNELEILQQLIGRLLISLDSSRAEISSNLPVYDFLDSIKLRFYGFDSDILLSASFDETNFGEDFIELRITNEKKPSNSIQIRPFFRLNIHPNFIVKKIEVYGESYSVTSENLNSKKFWKVEFDNPEQPITENVETENIILLYSDQRRLLINPNGSVPWLRVIVDNKLIDNLLFTNKELDRHKLKHTIE